MHADDLKPLKVADLRRILAAANSPPPARATKADLVARILDSKDAQDAYFSLYPPQQQQPPPAPQPLPAQQPPPPPPPPQQQQQQQQQPPPDASLSPEALELEKRKARAARFGIPLVNSPPGVRPALSLLSLPLLTVVLGFRKTQGTRAALRYKPRPRRSRRRRARETQKACRTFWH